MTSEEMISISEVHLESDPNRGNMVVLKENAEAERYFMMFVGDAEFAAIAKEKGLVEPKRPLTHELYLSIMDKLQLEFLRVILRANGEEHAIDSRPSDAVALALNRKVPILIRQGLFRRKLTQEEVKEYEGLVKSVKF
jgi:bifunctional DNase/RNase